MPAIRFRFFCRILQFNCCKADMTKVDVYVQKMWMVLFVTLLILPFSSFAQYNLHINSVDKDSAFLKDKLKLQTSFKNNALCATYVNNLPALLRTKGYSAASVDSARYDSTQATILLYVGETFRLAHLNTDSVDKRILDVIAWSKKETGHDQHDLQQVEAAEQKILDYLENNGYPFAKISLDSIEWVND